MRVADLLHRYVPDRQGKKIDDESRNQMRADEKSEGRTIRQDSSNDSLHQNGHHRRDSEVFETAESSPQTDSSVSQAQEQAPSSRTNQPAPETIRYPSPFPVQRGDWVVRLREGDPASMPSQDEGDVWDGPFQIVSGPSGQSGQVELGFPVGSKAPRTTDAQRLRLVHPVPQMPRRGIFHPTKGASVFVDRPDPKLHRGRKARTLFIVDRLRGHRTTSPGAGGVEYLVHWAGWPSEDDTWESSRGLPPSVVHDYEQLANPSATPRRRRRRKPLSPPPEEDEAAAAARTRRRRRRGAPALDSATRAEEGRDRRRRTRNSGFIEDLGV
ncbi:MAG: hypothetical protein M1813_008990 [Trichoglossum hirsutum]|nr:MAG: hypothetical protein M1813_008990 [Trichoglossum hirsutum]